MDNISSLAYGDLLPRLQTAWEESPRKTPRVHLKTSLLLKLHSSSRRCSRTVLRRSSITRALRWMLWHRSLDELALTELKSEITKTILDSQSIRELICRSSVEKFPDPSNAPLPPCPSIALRAFCRENNFFFRNSRAISTNFDLSLIVSHFFLIVKLLVYCYVFQHSRTH